MLTHSSPNASSFLHAHQFKCPLQFPTAHLIQHSSLGCGFPKSASLVTQLKKSLKFRCTSLGGQEEDYYLLDAPVSAGDGFSFSGGKYSDGSSPADEWYKQGKLVQAYLVRGSGKKAKDPIFGLKMASSSQASDDVFRWFCIERGNADNPTVVLIHGFPSQEDNYGRLLEWVIGRSRSGCRHLYLPEIQRQWDPHCVCGCGIAYSYRKVLPVLSKDYHVVAFDWLGFGFSEKPQPKYGFDYTMEEYVSSFKSLIDELVPDKVSFIVQGYFSPIVVKYASEHQDKINDIILLNPPITDKHANLPSTLSVFSNFLLGEIFSQDPLRASDKALTSCGPYKMKEDDAMVYRRPYLTSGSSGFALNAITRAMKKQLKGYVKEMRSTLTSENWKTRTTICWGQRDRWLNYDGVEDFCKASKHKLVELPMAGHHVQEDCGEELGRIIAELISKQR